jgi:hypothetical protein
MDNFVGKYFKYPLPKEELFVAFPVLDVLYMYTEEDKISTLLDALIETTHRIRQKLMWILGPSKLRSLVSFCV